MTLPTATEIYTVASLALTLAATVCRIFGWADTPAGRRITAAGHDVGKALGPKADGEVDK